MRTNHSRSLSLMRIAVPVVLLLLIGAGCINDANRDDDNDGDNGNSDPQYLVINGGMNDYVNCSNTFAFGLYEQLIAGHAGENIFFSPYSVSTALGMAYEGAENETATELRDVLDLPQDDAARLEMVDDTYALMNADQSAYDLSVANAYWLAEGGALIQAYQAVIEGYYHAHGEELDFAGDPAGAVDRINAWVEAETNGRIEDLLTPDMIKPLTYLVLTNAIAFEADWKYQFDADATDERIFHLSAGGSVTTEMMHMCDEAKPLNYAANDDAQLIQLPYEDEALSMFVLLPTAETTAALETGLTAAAMAELKSQMEAEYVDLTLPKFTFEQKYRLDPALIAMGMPTPFGLAADFSGITTDMELYIDAVIHQSFVEVDEEGTEAAAATAVVMVGKGLDDDSPDGAITFNADHPFIFFIEHRATGQILFMGKVENPAAD